MSDATAARRSTRRAHAHRRVPHPARRRPRVPRGPGHDAARPQRRRQDHDAAHDHGPVARVAGHAMRLRRPQRHHAALRDAARSPQLGIAYVPENMGIFADLTVQGEHAARRARGAHAPSRSTTTRLEVDLRPVPGGEEVLAPSGRQALGRAEADARGRRARSSSRASCCSIDEPSKGLAPAIINNLIDALRASSSAAASTILLVEQNFNFAKRARRHGRGDGQRPRRAPRRDGASWPRTRRCSSRLLGAGAL